MFIIFHIKNYQLTCARPNIENDFYNSLFQLIDGTHFFRKIIDDLTSFCTNRNLPKKIFLNSPHFSRMSLENQLIPIAYKSILSSLLMNTSNTTQMRTKSKALRLFRNTQSLIRKAIRQLHSSLTECPTSNISSHPPSALCRTNQFPYLTILSTRSWVFI